MLYRIYTENVNRRQIEKIIGRFFNGFTIFPACGYWQGKPEESLIIEIVEIGEMPPNVRERVDAICDEINTSNNQTCCMVVETHCKVRYC